MKGFPAILACFLVSAALTQGWCARPHATPLSAQDEAARREAAQRLNERNPIMVGMTEHWHGQFAEGALRLERIYRDRGMECHALAENYRSAAYAHWRVAHPVWCRTGNGAWALRG